MSSASTQPVSWKQYFGATVASYFAPWLGAYFGYVFIHVWLGFSSSWHSVLWTVDPIPIFFVPIPIPSFLAFYAVLIPDAIWAFLATLIPATISFLIILPFLHSRSRRLLAYSLICAGWVLTFLFPAYLTR
jgi:hypothetical protein